MLLIDSLSTILPLILSAQLALPETPRIQIHEALAGVNGRSRVQCVQLKIIGVEDSRWGPQGTETEGRLVLVFEDAAGTVRGRYVFPTDAPFGAADEDGFRSVLIATREFAETPGAPAPDFLLPEPLLARDGGRVTLEANPANSAWSIRLSLAYGDYALDTGTDTDDPPAAAGPPAPALRITGVRSLKRFQNKGAEFFGFGQQNADFRLGTPECRNSAGSTASFAAAGPVEVGEALFFQETFAGNSRTCGTCHLPAAGFSLPPERIPALGEPAGPDQLPLTDPLFVAENVPELAELESPELMRGGRGLILENIDGFDRDPVFRASPPLLNLELTAPFGQSGEFADLRAFSVNAVRQHFPLTLGRNADPLAGPLDFRLPTAEEQEALETFMNSLTLGGGLDLMLASAIRRGVAPELLRRGRKNFFGEGKCSSCHSGPAFSDVDPALVASGAVPGPGNQSFNIGVSRFSLDRGLPGPHETEREFNVRSLLGVSKRRFFFHDNSVEGLENAILFYCTECDETPFRRSPAFQVIGEILLDTEGLKAFLEALIEPDPSCVGGSGGPDCNGNGIADSCEIALFPERDCDGDGIPDSCQSTTIDCDGNAIADRCDIALDSALDCNRNGSLDVCDIRSGSSPDCNANGVPDSCEIAGGSASDENGNGIPDECEPEALFRFLRGDSNGDGKLDHSDAQAILRYLSRKHPVEPACLKAADANDDGRVDHSDVLALLKFLHRAAPLPPPQACGVDPTPDDLSCDSEEGCE